MALSKKEESEDRQGEHNALVAAEAVAKNAKSTKDREEAAENVVILETTSTPTTKTSSSSQKTQWLEQQQQSVSRILDETKENIIKATAEARKDIPRYTEVVRDYQVQTIEATKEIINNYVESQKEIINSFQSAWTPYLENVHQLNQYWIPLSPMTAVQAYIRMVSNFAHNMIWGTKLANNTIFAKGQGNTDTKFVVKIDHKDVDYKQVANNLNARILGIDFSKGDRIIEITGTQMRP
jgi:hypothetical protein